MPNSNIYLTGLGATIFALIKQRQGSLLSSERARDELTLSQIIPGATRVDTIRVLGVTLSSNLEMDIHVDTALATCASSMYALRVLRSHGLPQQSLHEVAKMTTVSSLMYASRAWWGFTSAGDRKRIGAFLARMKRRDFLPPQSPDANQMADRADERLFSAVVSNKNHVLHSRLPVKRPKIYDLRPRAHDYYLPPKDEQNYITRLLYKNIYR